MNERDFQLFPEAASTMAPRVDALYAFLVAVTVLMTLAIAVGIVVLGYKYRRRPGNEDTDHKTRGVSRKAFVLEIAWITIPFAVMLVMFAWGASVYASMYRPPAGATEIFITGRQWMWKAQHMGGQREINELHVPAGQPIKLVMTSEDVIHSFYVPAFRIKQDVLPGRYTTMWFEGTKPGTYHLFCAEYCGTKHSGMVGRVVVMEPMAYQSWLSRGGEGSLASSGEKLFQDLGCATCHLSRGQGRGPNLTDVAGRQVTLANGETVVADDTYLRESILNPTAKVVTGFSPIMPVYQGLVNEEGLLQLIAYIKSLSAPAPGAPMGAATAAPTGTEAAGKPTPAPAPKPGKGDKGAPSAGKEVKP